MSLEVLENAEMKADPGEGRFLVLSHAGGGTPVPVRTKGNSPWEYLGFWFADGHSSQVNAAQPAEQAAPELLLRNVGSGIVCALSSLLAAGPPHDVQ